MTHHYPNRQLYKQSHFILPILQPITYNPFKKCLIEQQQEQKYQVKKNSLCAVKKQQQQAQLQQKPTYQLTYSQQFQIIVGGENMYPLFIQTNQNNDCLIVCSQQCFLVIKIEKISQQTNIKKQSLTLQSSFLKQKIIKLGVYNKVVLDQPPNCLKATQNHVYFGMSDGKILCYDFIRKTLTGVSDDFTLPIMQIQSISENEILAIDSIGNVKYIEFSHKTFLDKIIKTLINTKQISIVYKVNKREKFKKLFQSVVSKKDDILGQSTASTSTSDSNKQSTTDSQSLSIGNTANTSLPTYSHNRISLPGQHLHELLIQTIKIIAIVRNNGLSILTCDEQFQLLQQQLLFDADSQCLQQGKIQQQQKSLTIGMVEFGIGGFENSNNTHLLIVFSIGNRLKYFKAVLAEDIYEWVYISQSIFDSKILDGKFISNNLILVVTQNNLSLINVTQHPQKIHTYNFSKFEYIDFFIKQQGLIFDRDLIKKSILRTINVNDNGNKRSEFLCLQGKRLLTAKIDSWDNYLQKYVDQYKFNQAMIMSLKIYNRQLKKLANINEKQQIRNKQMKQFFQKVALTFLSYEIKKQNSNKNEMLKMCIDFLVKTGCYQYLFTTIFEIVKSIGLEQLFLQTIDNYIMKGHIKVMTEQIINLMTCWYKNRDEKHKLQTMIQSFDLSLMEKSILLIICLKEHLYQSMIYICIQHGDFISPILKLCGIYYTQKLLNEQDKVKMTEILFFYLKECLLGHNTEFGNSQAYIEMLIQLINFLFIPNTLDMLVGISCKDTIKIVNMFFQTKVMQFILQNEGKFFIKKNDYVEMKIFQETCINQFKVYQKMLSTLIFIKDQSEVKKISIVNEQVDHQRHQYQDLSFQVNTFLSYLILKNQFPFQVRYKENAIFFFIEHSSLKSSLFSPNNSNILEKNDKHQKQVQSNAYFMRLMDSLMRSLEGKQQQKQKTLKIILNKLESSNSQSMLLQGQCYVLHELNRQTEVLRTFLKMTNQKIKTKVFDYLEFNITENVDLMTDFINNLQILMTMNKQRTTSLLYQINHSSNIDPQTIISNLNSYPGLQLEYIQLILKPNTSYFQFTNVLSQQKRSKLSLMHLNIVVRHKSSKLDSYIQLMDYPLEEAFKICQEKSNKTAKAYILIKSGRNMQGLLLLCDLFLKKCDEIFGQLARKKSLQQQKVSHLLDQLTKLLQSCHKQFQMDSQRGEKIWSKCLKKIFTHLRISQNMRNQSIPQPIKCILREIIQKTLKKMFSQMTPQYFMDKFCKRFPQLPFSVFIIAFGEVFDKMEFYSKLQLLQLQLQQKDVNRYVLNVLKSALRSHSSRSQCQICYQKLSFSNQKSWSIVTFSCGCIFHRQCVVKNTTTINENKQNLQKKQKQSFQPYHICMNDIERYAELKGIKVENLKAQVHQQMQLKKRIMKLKDYETNQGLVFQVPSFNFAFHV